MRGIIKVVLWEYTFITPLKNYLMKNYNQAIARFATTITEQSWSHFKFMFIACCVMLCGIAVKAQPVISSLSAQSGIPGASVTISGSGFNTTPANNIVYFGGMRATVTAAGTSSL